MTKAQQMICLFKSHADEAIDRCKKEAVQIIHGEDGDTGYRFADGSQCNYIDRYKLVLVKR